MTSCLTVYKATLLSPLHLYPSMRKSSGDHPRFSLTLSLLTTTIVAPPSNASKWQMGFNSAFKGLMSLPPFYGKGPSLNLVYLQCRKHRSSLLKDTKCEWFPHLVIVVLRMLWKLTFLADFKSLPHSFSMTR